MLYENDTNLSVCVELISNLKNDLELNLTVVGFTATGESASVVNAICMSFSAKPLIKTLMEHLH